MVTPISCLICFSSPPNVHKMKCLAGSNLMSVESEVKGSGPSQHAKQGSKASAKEKPGAGNDRERGEN